MPIFYFTLLKRPWLSTIMNISFPGKKKTFFHKLKCLYFFNKQKKKSVFSASIFLKCHHLKYKKTTFLIYKY